MRQPFTEWMADHLAACLGAMWFLGLCVVLSVSPTFIKSAAYMVVVLFISNCIQLFALPILQSTGNRTQEKIERLLEKIEKLEEKILSLEESILCEEKTIEKEVCHGVE